MIPICILAIEDSDDREFMSQLFVQYQRLMYSTIFEILHDTWATEDVRRGIRQEKQHRTGKEYLTPAACQHVIHRNPVQLGKRRQDGHIRQTCVGSFFGKKFTNRSNPHGPFALTIGHLCNIIN